MDLDLEFTYFKFRKFVSYENFKILFKIKSIFHSWKAKIFFVSPAQHLLQSLMMGRFTCMTCTLTSISQSVSRQWWPGEELTSTISASTRTFLSSLLETAGVTLTHSSCLQTWGDSRRRWRWRWCPKISRRLHIWRSRNLMIFSLKSENHHWNLFKTTKY